MNPISKIALASSMTVLLAACGGGSAGGQAGPSNGAPSSNGSINDTNTSAPEVVDTNNETPDTPAVEETPEAAPAIIIPPSTPESNTEEETEEEPSVEETPVQNSPEPIESPEPNESPESNESPQPEDSLEPENSPETNEAPEPSIADGTISAAYLSSVESELTNTPLMQSVKSSIATIDNAEVEQIEPLRSANPANVQRVEAIVSESDWEYLFSKRAPEYSYDKFLKAIGKFPAFCGDYDDGRDAEAICRKSLATMFAHFTQETGGHTAHWDVEEWRQGLVHVREMGWTETMLGGYNGECNPDVWQGQTWPCGTFENGEFKSYFGRGAKQLSYNYNYGPFSEAMFGDVSVLLEDPGLVADTWLNLASAVFFYVYPQPPKPSMLHVIDGTWEPNARDIENGLVKGFGVTTQIINGGVECGGSTEIAQSLNRISYYKSFAEYLGVDVPEDEVLGCAGMKQFDAQGDGALNIYWEQDWSFVAGNPDGASYACKLVGYQTPFSAFKEGDYAKCVEHHFDVTAVGDAGQEWIDESEPVTVPESVSEPEQNEESEQNQTPEVSEPEATSENTPENEAPEIEAPIGQIDPEQPTSLIAPAKPTIAWMASSYPGTEATITVSWNMWWGDNGNAWAILLDGTEVHAGSLTANGQSAQSGSASILVEGQGEHTIVVQLCNTAGSSSACTSSEPVSVSLSGGSDSGADSGSGTPDNNSTDSGSNNDSTDSTGTNDADIVTPEQGMYGDMNKVYKQTSGKVIASYFVEWGVYGRDYHVADIPASNLTHLLYGFIAICGDNSAATAGARSAIARECADKQENEITIVDSFATLEKTYPGDTWSDNVYGDHYNGNFGQLRKLKQQYPNLVILPSVGGWTLSTPFFAMAKDASKRAVFVNSVIEFLKKYEFFDGVDIDWEFPGVDGADVGYASEDDRAGYTNLMRDMRLALDELSLETGRVYEITSAVGSGPDKIDAVDYSEAHQYMDYIFMMTYDFAGAWESTTGHHTPLYGNQEFHEGYNTADAVERMLAQGVPSEKVVVGAAMYARAWRDVQNTNSHAQDLFPLYGAGAGPAQGTWEAGVYDYKDIYENYIGSNNEGINGFTVYYDEVAEAPYLWNESTGEFITYDSPRSIAAKADFVEQYNLGGFLSWEIDGDNGLILNAINEGLGNEEVQ